MIQSPTLDRLAGIHDPAEAVASSGLIPGVAITHCATTQRFRELVRAANKGSGTPVGWFIYKGVVFASDAAVEHAPKTDPNLSQQEVDAVMREVAAWFHSIPRLVVKVRR